MPVYLLLTVLIVLLIGTYIPANERPAIDVVAPEPAKDATTMARTIDTVDEVDALEPRRAGGSRPPVTRPRAAFPETALLPVFGR